MGLQLSSALCPPTPVFGKVTTSCNDTPLKGVKVWIEDEKDYTDKFGFYSLSVHGNGWHWLYAKLAGYVDYKAKVNIGCGFPIIKNFEIEPSDGCNPEHCGDGTCNNEETCESCFRDCGACPPEEFCGDQVCNNEENCASCPMDCGGCPPEEFCGDLICNNEESCNSCPQDCGDCEIEVYCGDGICNNEETCNSCAPDCGNCKPSHHKNHPPCDHCFVLGGLANWYQEIMYGYWFKYAERCGLDYDRDEPQQNLRWRCDETKGKD